MLQGLFFLLTPIIKPLKRFNVGFLYLPAHDLSCGLTRRYEILITALAVIYLILLVQLLLHLRATKRCHDCYPILTSPHSFTYSLFQ